VAPTAPASVAADARTSARLQAAPAKSVAKTPIDSNFMDPLLC
jgi:hypothetical protein